MSWRLVGLLVVIGIIVVVLLFHAWSGYQTFSRLHANLPKDSQIRVLDFGTGSGYLGYLLSRQYPNLRGLDVVDYNLFLQTEVYDGVTIPYPDKFFDCTVCNYVLHHAPNQQQLLDEIKRVTRDRILIHEDTPMSPVEWSHASHHIGDEDPLPVFHTKEDWREIFRRHQLKIIYEEPIPWWMGTFNNRVNKHFFVLTPE